MPFELIQTRIDFAIIELPRSFADRFEKEGFWVKFGINTKKIQNNTWRGSIISTSNDISIADDEQEFTFVIVLQSCQRVYRSA